MRVHTRKWLFVGAIVLAATVLAACGNDEGTTTSSVAGPDTTAASPDTTAASSETTTGAPSADEEIQLVLLVPELANPYWAAGVAGAEDAAADLGVEMVISGTADFTVDEYVTQLQNAISGGADGVLIAPGDPNAGLAVIEEARAQEVAVATVIVDSPDSERQFFVGPNAVRQGEQQARRVLAELNNRGATGSVAAAVTSCSPDAISQVVQREAFERVLTDENEYSDAFTVEVVTFLDATAEPETNLATFENLAQAQPDLQIVFPMCGIDTISAGTVAKRLETGWIVSGDAWVPDTLDLIEEGYITWSVNEAPYENIALAVTQMTQALRGEMEMPSGIFFADEQIAVIDVDAMAYLPADEIVSVEEARTSPDAVG